MSRITAALAVLVGVACVTSSVGAEAEDETLFEKGVAALVTGAHDEAIQTFEALADRGQLHPDLSFDRCLAYLGRVRTGAERPGDLGRAAAAVEETLLMRPDDADAETALDLIRAEVARRRARGGGGSEIDARPTLERAVVGLASEQTWALFAGASSALLSFGLLLRWRWPRAPAPPQGAAPQHEGPGHVAAAVAVPLGAALLLVFALLGWGARHLRTTSDLGVVVVPEAHLVTERGALASGPAIPEAARVELGQQRGSLVEVRWGAAQGFTQTDAVRRIRGAP
jgi:hypothetical protein